MTVENLCIAQLRELEILLQNINSEEYTLEVSKNNSLPELINEICTLYLSLLDGAIDGVVCYKKWKVSNTNLNPDLKRDIYNLSKIQSNIPKEIKNFPMKLIRLDDEQEIEIAVVSTTYCRELLFCFEETKKKTVLFFSSVKTKITL